MRLRRRSSRLLVFPSFTLPTTTTTNTRPPGTPSKRSGRYLQPDDDDRGAPQGAFTVESILGADIEGYQCEVCDEVGSACQGAECVAIFQALLASREARYLEIREAGTVGMGMFAKRAIKKGTLVCEYTGRLMPIDFTDWPADSSYTWHVAGTCRVDSVVFGNIGRFSNHHCTEFSCDAVDLMYGRRRVLCYRARRDIAKDEQIYVNYGMDYFTADKPCLCTAAGEAHLLGPNNRVKPLVTKKSAWEAMKKLAAEKEKKKRSKSRSRSRSPVMRSANKVKVTKPTRVITRSRL